MAETLRATLHRVIGGWWCQQRRRHHLVLVEHHRHERTGLVYSIEIADRKYTLHHMQEQSTRRPMCTICQQMPPD